MPQSEKGATHTPDHTHKEALWSASIPATQIQSPLLRSAPTPRLDAPVEGTCRRGLRNVVSGLIIGAMTEKSPHRTVPTTLLLRILKTACPRHRRRRRSAPPVISGLFDEDDMDIAIDPLALKTSCHLSYVFTALR